jgi:hypothetical protein
VHQPTAAAHPATGNTQELMRLTITLIRPSQINTDQSKTGASQVPRDRYDRPLIRPPGADKAVPYTRCTTYVDCIEDKSSLATWGKRMVVVGATHAPGLIEQARHHDPQEPRGKKALNRLAEQLVTVAGAHHKREKGTYLHALSEHVDRRQPLPPSTTQDRADMAAYRMATLRLDVLHIEQLVVVDHLKIAGTPDRAAFYAGPGPDGQPFAGNLITDLKTGSVEYGGLKMAMQLAVYSRGLLYDHTTGTRTPLPDVNQDWGLIIHLPAGTAQCTLHWVDLALGWEAVQVARQVRALRARRKLLIPVAQSVATDTPNTVADQQPTA